MGLKEVLVPMQRLMACGAIIALIAVCVSVSADTVQVSAGTEFGITIDATDPVVRVGSSAAVRGRIVLQPSDSVEAPLTNFVIDDAVKLMTDIRMPQYALDTTALDDGVHEVRIDYTDGQVLLASTGAIPLHIYNTTHQAVFRQIGLGSPNFFKVQRKVLLHEIVWFNEREADLEKHGFISNRRVYITLTDLMRHIGGGIIWGPSENYIEVHRNDMVVRVIPGSSRIYVDGRRQSLGRSAIRMENRTYVPLRRMCQLFGIGVDWNRIENRALVSFAQ